MWHSQCYTALSWTNSKILKATPSFQPLIPPSPTCTREFWTDLGINMHTRLVIYDSRHVFIKVEYYVIDLREQMMAGHKCPRRYVGNGSNLIKSWIEIFEIYLQNYISLKARRQMKYVTSKFATSKPFCNNFLTVFPPSLKCLSLSLFGRSCFHQVSAVSGPYSGVKSPQGWM